MMKNMSKIYQLLVIVLIVAISASCAATTATVKPVIPPTTSNSTLKIIDIVGIREWKPLQESTLNCAMDGDEDNTLKYTWSADQGTIKGEGKQVTWIAPGVAGDYKVSVIVTDKQGNTAIGEVNFNVYCCKP